MTALTVSEFFRLLADFAASHELSQRQIGGCCGASCSAPDEPIGFVVHSETLQFDDGFVADVGEYGQPMPRDSDGLTYVERGGRHLTEAGRAAHLRWMQYNGDGDPIVLAVLASVGLKFIGSPEHQHYQWKLAREQHNPNIVAGPA